MAIDLYISVYLLIIYLCWGPWKRTARSQTPPKKSEMGARTSDTYFRKPIHIEKFLSEALPLDIAVSCCWVFPWE
jgi:hypothetical protein